MTADASKADPAETALLTLRRQVTEVCLRERWGRSLAAIGAVHLAFFIACHVVYVTPGHRPWHHVALWFAEVGVILVLLRLMNGRLWFRKAALAGLVVRLWASFLIIAFNAATLNSLTGFAVDWYKLAWTGLSTLAFAATAWLLGSRFLIPAVQMYFTGLLMAAFPRWSFLIYGVSWSAALIGIGLYLERLGRARQHAAPASPAPERLRQGPLRLKRVNRAGISGRPIR
jgi:hypothetical protein